MIKPNGRTNQKIFELDIYQLYLIVTKMSSKRRMRNEDGGNDDYEDEAGRDGGP